MFSVALRGLPHRKSMVIFKVTLVQIVCSLSCSVVSHVLMVSVLHKEVLCLLTVSSADLGSRLLLHSSIDLPSLDFDRNGIILCLACAWDMLCSCCFEKRSQWVAHAGLELAVLPGAGIVAFPI